LPALVIGEFGHAALPWPSAPDGTTNDAAEGATLPLSGMQRIDLTVR